jgi:hypothetical protein
MAEFKNLARAFLPGAAAAERHLKNVAAQVEEEDAERDHGRKVRGFDRRTDEALSEGRTLAAEFNLQQMKRAIAAARTGAALAGPAAARAIEGPPRSMPVIEGPPVPDAEEPAPSPCPPPARPEYGRQAPAAPPEASPVSDGEIEELAMRFARQAEGLDDPIDRQRLYRQWSQDLRRAMPEFQAVEVERRARAIVNSYR